MGQGVNCAMEGSTVLDRCLGEHSGDIPAAMAAFQAQWKPESDAMTAIAERVGAFASYARICGPQTPKTEVSIACIQSCVATQLSHLP